MMEPVQMSNSWTTQQSLPCLQPAYRLGAPLQQAADNFVTTLDAAFTRHDLQYPRSVQLPHQLQQPPITQQTQHLRHQASNAHIFTSHDASAASSATSFSASTKPAVPRLNLSKHEGLGFGSAGGIDTSASARSTASTASSIPPHLQRTAVTSRTGFAQAPPPQQQQPPPRSGGQEEAASTSVPWESGPITPAQALKRYREYLTNYEQSEILEYPQVYFVGRGVAQKVQGSPHLPKSNHGYDDERGDYECVMHDHISYRYEILGVLGKGSFGQVLKCHDFKTNSQMALKIIRNKKRFHHQALVEVKILDHLKQRDTEDCHHIIHMQEYTYFRNHLCITFELLSVNLYEFIKQNNFAGLSLALIRRFASQMLRSLKYLKSLNVIHCDLKPENILLKHPNRSIIKIIDFGSSCFTDEKVYTYIQSRFYRSPEVILGLSYGSSIDMWSFGCILAELYTGYPLFPGESEQEQLLCIMEVMGLPPRSLLEHASRTKMFFDQRLMPRIVPNSRGKTRTPGSKSLQGVLKCTDAAFLDLLEACLRWNPLERISPEAALQHLWLLDHNATPTPTTRGSLSGSRQELPKAAHSSWRKSDEAPLALPSLNWAQAAQQQQAAAQQAAQQQAAAQQAAAQQAAQQQAAQQQTAAQQAAQQQAAAQQAAQQHAQHQQQQQRQQTSASDMAVEASSLALGYGVLGDADSIYPRAINGVLTARAMMGGSSALPASGPGPLMLQRAALQQQQPQQQMAPQTWVSPHRTSAYSGGALLGTPRGQGTPPVQMVTPRSLLYESYSMHSPAQQQQQQQQQQRQRLQVAQAPPAGGAALYPVSGGGAWGSQQQPGSLQMLGPMQEGGDQCFFPQLPRR